MKKCSKCGIEKPLSEFNSDKRKKDGKYTSCKTCHSLSAKTWQKKNPEKVKNARWLREFGVSFEFIENLKVKQNNCCAICKKELNLNVKAHIDHCHTTGKVRGILCQKCNQGLGLFYDSIQALTNAIEYISHHETKL
jgi:hypothetical protein